MTFFRFLNEDANAIPFTARSLNQPTKHISAKNSAFSNIWGFEDKHMCMCHSTYMKSWLSQSWIKHVQRTKIIFGEYSFGPSIRRKMKMNRKKCWHSLIFYLIIVSIPLDEFFVRLWSAYGHTTVSFQLTSWGVWRP